MTGAINLTGLLAPWAAVREARDYAERLLDRIHALRGDNEALRRAVDALTIERDAAWAKLAARSAAISRGNRTRALRRRGALLPEPITPASQPIRGHD